MEMLYKLPIFLMERMDVLPLIIQENKYRLLAAKFKHESTRVSRTVKVFRMRKEKLSLRGKEATGETQV
jgi:hypothetical protein